MTLGQGISKTVYFEAFADIPSSEKKKSAHNGCLIDFLHFSLFIDSVENNSGDGVSVKQRAEGSLLIPAANQFCHSRLRCRQEKG